MQIGSYRRHLASHFLSNIVRRKWKVAGQVAVKHSCQDRKVRFLLMHETSNSLQPQLPQVNHTKCLVSLKRGEEEQKHLHLWLLLSKLCSCEEKGSQSCFPTGQAPACAGAWGYSSTGARLCISIFWTSEFYALTISPACKDPSKWQHNTLDEQFIDICKAVLSFKRFPSSRLAVLTKGWTPSINWWSCLEMKSRWINCFLLVKSDLCIRIN